MVDQALNEFELNEDERQRASRTRQQVILARARTHVAICDLLSFALLGMWEPARSLTSALADAATINNSTDRT